MPALRKTDQERRYIAFLEALARGKAGKGLNDSDIAEAAGIRNATLSTYRNKGPWTMEFGRFCKMARKVGMNGRELCKIAGIPYKCDGDESQPTRT